jgi:hypothetical protein
MDNKEVVKPLVPEENEDLLQTDTGKGLSDAEVQQRLAIYGPNSIYQLT